MSIVSARKLVTRLKDDKGFRDLIHTMDENETWRMIEKEGYECSREEVVVAYNKYGCGQQGPIGAWRNAVKKVTQLPIKWP